MKHGVRDVLGWVVKWTSWGCSRMLLGVISQIFTLTAAFVPIWVDRSEKTVASVGETTYYGFPVPIRRMSEWSACLDNNLIPSLIVNAVFWAGVVAFCDLRFIIARGEKITVRRLLVNWMSVCIGVVCVCILPIVVTLIVDLWRTS